jgi:hypothetical protein
MVEKSFSQANVSTKERKKKIQGKVKAQQKVRVEPTGSL